MTQQFRCRSGRACARDFSRSFSEEFNAGISIAFGSPWEFKGARLNKIIANATSRDSPDESERSAAKAIGEAIASGKGRTAARRSAGSLVTILGAPGKVECR
jgi:Fe-S cluster assembly ATPase SufC